MPKFKIDYKYLTSGVVWVEAKNKKEAGLIWMNCNLDQETIEKWYNPKITLEK